MHGPDDDTSDGSRADVRDLRRSLWVNVVGYVFKIVHPLLFFVVAALYGAERLGIFGWVESMLLLGMRVSLLGFDKSLLWWVAQRPPGREREGIPAMVGWVVAASALCAGSMFFVGASLVTEVFAQDQWSPRERAEAVDTLAWMSIALVPMALMDFFVHAAVARRRIEAQSILRDGLVPLLHAVAALVAFGLGIERLGLGLAFLVAQGLGLIGAYRLYRGAFAGTPPGAWAWRPPRRFVSYAGPIWLSEMSQSLLLRLDMFLLAYLTDPATVGVYQVVMRIGNAMRTIRRSFDPLVIAIVSKIGARPDPERLRATFSYATVLVVATQMPVYAALFSFTDWILPLLGGDFTTGARAVLILCAFWVLNGVIGLNGFIVSGFGRSWLVFFNALIVVLFEGIALWWLVPSMGIDGAALAVGLAYTGQNVLQAGQARAIAGIWPYDRSVLWVLVVSAVATLALLGSRWAIGVAGSDAGARIGSFAAFCLIAAAGSHWLRRTGRAFRS